MQEMEGEGKEAVYTAPLFLALTRPRLVMGAPYNYFVGNILVVSILFLLTNSLWFLLAVVPVHLFGMIAMLWDERIFDIMEVRMMRIRAARQESVRFWGAKSYRP